MALDLHQLFDTLVGVYGPAPASPSTDPFVHILEENVAYLADPARRKAALALLRDTVGTTPTSVLEADPERLEAVGAFGILLEDSARKLRESARIAVEEFGGDLQQVLELPTAQAKRALRRFPGIGEPGAEKILLLCRGEPLLAPESNGLRVLQRVGLVPDGLSYAATYRAARDLVANEEGLDGSRLADGRNALMCHGRTLCRNRSPACRECPLSTRCPSAPSA